MLQKLRKSSNENKALSHLNLNKFSKEKKQNVEEADNDFYLCIRYQSFDIGIYHTPYLPPNTTIYGRESKNLD